MQCLWWTDKRSTLGGAAGPKTKAVGENVLYLAKSDGLSSSVQADHARLRRSQSDLRKSVSQFFGHSDAVKEMMHLVVSTYLLFDKAGKGFIYYVSARGLKQFWCRKMVLKSRSLDEQMVCTG